MSRSENSLRRLRGRINRCAHTERILGQLSFAVAMSEAAGGKHAKTVDQVIEYLEGVIDAEGCVTREAAARAEEMLRVLEKEAKSYTMHCVAHAHIDMNWMWRYDETVAVTLDTVRTMLDLMDEYPQFTFSQSQASVYRIIADHGPAGMLEELRRRVEQGRWEVTASTWVEADKNTPNGESMARHLLYTRQYLSRLLGLDGKTLQLDFEPDTFGHSKNVPEILSAGGVKYYYHVRGSMDPALCWWQSDSGARVLSYRDPLGYGCAIDCECASYMPGVCAQLGIDSLLKVYGVGDHGGGPTRRDLDKLISMQSWPVFPRVVFSTYRAFFEDVAARFGSKLPVRSTEMNSVFTGCYTTQTRIKLANRTGEASLYDSELLAAVAAVRAGYPYASEKYAEAWKKILFNQFHDILTGSGIRDTREYAMGEFQRVMATANTERAGAMRAVAGLIDTSAFECAAGDPHYTADGAGVGSGVADFKVTQVGRTQSETRVYHVFNTASFDRRRVTELTVWDWPQDDVKLIEVLDADGAKVPCQVLDHGLNHYWGHYFVRLLIEAEVPACGYSTYVVRRSADSTLANRFGEGGVFRADGEPEWQRVAVPYSYVLENRHLRAEFDLNTGDVNSLIDKHSGRELLRAPAGMRIIDEDPDRGMTSWRVGRYMNVRKPTDVHIKLEGHLGDTLRQRLTVRSSFGSSSLTVQVSLDRDSRELVFDVSCDWHELAQKGVKVPQLNFAAPLGFTAEGYRYDVPCGAIVREGVDMDQPGNSFIAALPKEGGTALMLSSDCKYGFRGFDDTVSATLIRQSYEPDPCPEYGMHRFKLALALTDGGESAGSMIARSFSLWHEFASVSAPAHKGSLPLRASLCALDGAVLQSVKLAEDGSGDMIVRAYNPEDSDVIAVFTAPAAVSRAVLTDLHEQPAAGGELKAEQNRVSLTLGKQSLATVRLSL